MKKSQFIIFTDFDGTITLNDVGDKLFQKFGNEIEMENLFNNYISGKISETECWTEGCKLLTEINYDNFRNFILEQKIDQSFKNFYNFCQNENIPLIILSGGFNQYIKIILEKENLTLPFFANDLIFKNDETVFPKFDFTDETCVKCANCKRNHIITKSSEEQIIVYIGNGYSDFCPAKYADIVFAKDSLVRFCEMENITFKRFDNFNDLLEKFKNIIENEKPKKRKSAELLRKEVIMME